MLGEQRNVALAGVERRQGHDFERQPIEQVGAEAALLDQPGKMLVGRGDDPHVDRDRLGRADAGDFAIFDRAQQPVLRRRRQGRQLVEEQGAAVRLLEPAVAGLGGAGEAAGLMTEQLGLDQIFGQRRAVHRHQRPRPARRQVMQPLGNQLLAGAALADYQHRAVERRGAARPLDRVEKGQALTDELIGPFHAANMWWQIPPSGKIFRPPFGRNLAVLPEFWRYLNFWHKPCKSIGDRAI